MSETKFRSLQIKTVPSDGSGQFTAILAAFGPPADHQGEYFEGVGTFTDSITTWQRRGQRVPVYYNHSYEAPNSRIGELVSMHEIPTGLLVEGQLNLKNPLALEVYEAMLNGSLNTLSIGFSYVAKRQADDGVVITKADVIEATFTPIPAEPRAVLLDVKSRDGNSRAEKSARAGEIMSYVKARALPPAIENDLAARLALVVDDDAATVDDLNASVNAFLEMRVTVEKTRRENSAKLRDRGVRAQIDDLEADLYVTKGSGRHQSVADDATANEHQLREHLLQRHGNDVTTVQLGRMSLDEMRTLHKLVHGGGAPKGGKPDTALTKAVDDLIEDVRWQANRDRADRDAFDAANAAIQLSGRAPGFSPDAERERELELQQRDLERIEARATERDAERASAEESARISREHRDWHGDSYWSNTPVETLDDVQLRGIEPRITDEIVTGLGTTFSAPVAATVDPDPYRVTPPEDVPTTSLEATGAAETVRVPMNSVDTPEPTVPTETETFRIYAHQPEDSKLVAPEPPVSENLEVGPTFRMPAGGEVKREQPDDIRIPKGGEVE